MVSYHYITISHYIINISYAIQSIMFDNGWLSTIPSFILDIACIVYCLMPPKTLPYDPTVKNWNIHLLQSSCDMLELWRNDVSDFNFWEVDLEIQDQGQEKYKYGISIKLHNT